MTDDINLENIMEQKEALAGAQPSEGWEKMEEAAREGRARAQQSPGYTQGENIPAEDVPESERLQRPVGTESDSY